MLFELFKSSAMSLDYQQLGACIALAYAIVHVIVFEFVLKDFINQRSKLKD